MKQDNIFQGQISITASKEEFWKLINFFPKIFLVNLKLLASESSLELLL